MFNVVFIPWDSDKHLQSLAIESDEEIPKRIAVADDDADLLNVIASLLVRSQGLYAHHDPTGNNGTQQQPPNIRATRLCMACGLLSMRLRGNVIVSLSPQKDLQVDDISAAASHDLRPEILRQLVDDPAAAIPPPAWLLEASRENYHDAAVLQRLARVMNRPEEKEDDGESGEDDSASDDSSDRNINNSIQNEGKKLPQTFVTTVPLCLECRRPDSELCPNCEGAYFCSSLCRAKG